MKRLIAVTMVFIIMISSLAVYGDSQNDTVQELLSKAKGLLYTSSSIKENAIEALTLLDKVIELDATCIEAYDHKAYALYDLGRGSEAIAVYDDAIKAIPDADELYFRKSDYLMRLKRYNEAIVCFDKMLQSKDADFLRAYSGLVMERKADVLFELKRYSEAIVYYDKLIAESGFYYSLDYGMKKGMALMELKKYSEASKWFNEVKKHVVPYEYEQYARVYYSSACAYSMLKKTSQTLADLELAIKYDKSYKVKAKTEKYLKNISSSKKFAKILTFEEDLIKRLKLAEGFYLIDHLTYDINGDKIADDIALIGHEVFNEGINIDQIILVIIDNKAGKYTRITPKYTEGQIYANRKDYLLPKDLNGDGIKDVIIQIGNGFSTPGWTQCGYSFKGNKAVMIFAKETDF